MEALSSNLEVINQSTDSQAPQEPGNEHNGLEEKMDTIISIAERIEKGESVASYKLIEVYGFSRPTAIRYRNAALKLINQDSKAWTMDTIRNLEIGRLTALQGRITEKMADFEKKADWDAWNKLVGRLNEVSGQLHKITGLNTEVKFNVGEQKRIVIVRPEAKADVKSNKPIDTSHTQPEEGQLIEKGITPSAEPNNP